EVINIFPPQTITISPTTIKACEGDGIITITTKLDSPSSGLPVEWSWTDPNGNPIGGNSPTLDISDGASNTGTYTVTAITGGCEYIGVAEVEITETIQADDSHVNICGTDTEVQIPVFITNFIPGETYTYDLSYGGNETQTNTNNSDENPIYFTVDKIGTYTVNITSDTQCPGSATITVGKPIIEIIGDISICENDIDPKNLPFLKAKVSGTSSTNITYEWFKDGNPTAFGNKRKISPSTFDESGIYTVKVTITDDNGTVCIIESAAMQVDIYKEPYFELPETVLCGWDVTVILAPENLEPAPSDPDTYIYEWTTSNGGVIPPGTENNPTIEISEEGRYRLTISTPGSNSCSYT
ncbi:MAG: hypothetical protein KAG37_08160, partial [Flavobacteriales bacterium]|nr:hypothetical protein [Flavobacteriales bacterium]